MKHIRIKKIFFLLMIGGFFISLFSCKKDNAGGQPVISQVRAIAPAPNDSILLKAGPGEWVVIQGDNLAGALQIFFNGYPATFNPALFTENNLVVLIPADMPFATLLPADLNTIKIVTPNGTVVYAFPIVPPPPVVSTVSNENATAGALITIKGGNFFYVDKVVFPGNIEVTSVVANPAGNELELTVPAGITTAGVIKVVKRYGTGASLYNFNDMATGILCNFDNLNKWGGWGLGANGVISDALLFPGNRGMYAHMKIASVPAGDWNTWSDNGRFLGLDSMQWVPMASVNDDPANWVLKFEIFVKNPWPAGCMFIQDGNWGRTCRFEPWKDGGVAYKTTGWTTITIPLSNFKSKANETDGTGTPAATLSQLIGAGGKSKLQFGFANPTIAVSDLDMAIDNIRIVKK